MTSTDSPPTAQQLAEITARAAYLHEYATLTDAPLQTTADQLTGTDVPVLVEEIRRLRVELDTAESAHRFTLRQRNNRSTRITHLRDLANTAATGGAADVEALIEAARDTLAASVDDHTPRSVVSAAADKPGE